MSVFKYIKSRDRYNKDLSFHLTGIDVKTILDEITRVGGSDNFKTIRVKKSYNKDLHIPLSGIEVKKIIDSLPCPLDDVKYIKASPRYNTKFEFILTGKHVKIIVDSIRRCDNVPLCLYIFEDSTSTGYSAGSTDFFIYDVATSTPITGNNFNLHNVVKEAVALDPSINVGIVGAGISLSGGSSAGWFYGEEPPAWGIEESGVSTLPISWNLVSCDAIVPKCYTATIVGFFDGLGLPNIYMLNRVALKLPDGTTGFSTPGTVIGGPDVETFLQDLVTVIGGSGATCSTSKVGDDLVISIRSYTEFVEVVMEDTLSNLVTFSFTEIPC